MLLKYSNKVALLPSKVRASASHALKTFFHHHRLKCSSKKLSRKKKYHFQQKKRSGYSKKFQLFSYSFAMFFSES